MHEFKYIPVHQGTSIFLTMVDVRDYETLSKKKWWLNDGGYVVANGYKPNGKYGHVKMHRVVCPSPEGMHTDHVNGCKLDHRREYLRVLTPIENQWGKRGMKQGNSKYKGVHFYKAKGKWIAQITEEYVVKHLGSFDTELEAAEAYNEAIPEKYKWCAYHNPVGVLV